MDWIGYLASTFLAISLIVSNSFKFRIFSSLGCLTFIVYGFLVNAFPVMLANGILLVINVYQLWKLTRIEEQFLFVPILPENRIVQKFLNYYSNDIKNYFPDFVFDKVVQKQISYVVLRDIAIANMFVAVVKDNGDAIMKVNYTVPQYRDYKVTKFIIEREANTLKSHGIKKLVYESVFNPSHLQFLKVVGFTKELIEGKECWIKSI
ncbi:MAG: YgjV family protein [Chitinophagaceae bacterium]|nr:YgjV family protein [Chitinophagaceae bacterium]